MKRETALRYARTISDRLHAVNGILATPLCGHRALRFRRVWIFGSTIKGAADPNDLDVLIDCFVVGPYQRWPHVKVDKRYLHDYGCRVAPNSINEGFRWLARGMRNVSRHSWQQERALGIDKMVMIYPRNDMVPK